MNYFFVKVMNNKKKYYSNKSQKETIFRMIWLKLKIINKKYYKS